MKETKKRSNGLETMQKWLKKLREAPPPVRWLLVFMVAALGFAILNAPRPRVVDYTIVNFNTSADSRIYFNNMRSYWYEIDRLSRQGTEIFRLKRRSAERDSSNLNFAIINPIGSDQVFIYTELGAFFESCPNLSLHYSLYSDSDSLRLLNAEQHFGIAAKVHSSLIENGAIYLCCGSDTLKTLYQDRREALDAEVVLEDYFRLILRD